VTDDDGSPHGSISIDGARYALVDGQWALVPSPLSEPAVGRPPVPDGYVSVGGAWFRTVDGRLEPTTSPLPAAPARGRPIPEGYVSVDGALLRVEAPSELESAPATR
jgi:hypothetical protein